MTKRKAITLITLISLVTFGILYLMDRNIVCECGYIKLWHSAVISSENSQHIFDWYSLTHFIHGLAFYLILVIVEKVLKTKIPVLSKLVIAVIMACGWEILENSDYVINRYRTATISLDYFGDSIINSAGDILAMSLGFWFANKRPVWQSAVVFFTIEIFLLLAIRDNLLINIIMLVRPIEALKLWQNGG